MVKIKLPKKKVVKVKKKKEKEVEKAKEEVTLRPEVTGLETRLEELNTLRNLMMAERITRASQLEIKIEQTQAELNKIR